jgi:hypothetical protein
LNNDKRPLTVTAFEALNVASVLLEMVITETDSPLEELFTSAVWVALTLCITRGRSRVARLIYTLLTAFAAAALLGAYRLGYVPSDTALPLALRFSVEVTLLLALLWSPSTSDWLTKRGREVRS